MKTKYVIVGTADEWYEDGECWAILYDYQDALNWLKENTVTDTLIERLNWLESCKEQFEYNGYYELVISYN
jgi:hypothetical protein